MSYYFMFCFIIKLLLLFFVCWVIIAVEKEISAAMIGGIAGSGVGLVLIIVIVVVVCILIRYTR